jgi:hypothetical protein
MNPPPVRGKRRWRSKQSNILGIYASYLIPAAETQLRKLNNNSWIIHTIECICGIRCLSTEYCLSCHQSAKGITVMDISISYQLRPSSGSSTNYEPMSPVEVNNTNSTKLPGFYPLSLELCPMLMTLYSRRAFQVLDGVHLGTAPMALKAWPKQRLCYLEFVSISTSIRSL